jgi:hypothetical protein
MLDLDRAFRRFLDRLDEGGNRYGVGLALRGKGARKFDDDRILRECNVADIMSLPIMMTLPFCPGSGRSRRLPGSS